MPESQQTVPVGTAHVLCADCGTEIPVSVSGTLTTAEGGQQYLACEPDMTDLWAHAWTHGVGA